MNNTKQHLQAHNSGTGFNCCLNWFSSMCILVNTDFLSPAAQRRLEVPGSGAQK